MDKIFKATTLVKEQNRGELCLKIEIRPLYGSNFENFGGFLDLRGFERIREKNIFRITQK
jgi:hypothetical protein